MCLNSLGNLKDYVYMDGHPCIHGNIVGFINNSKKQCRNANCIFVETINDKERFMSRIVKLYVCVVAIQNLFVEDELLVDYNFSRPIPIQNKDKQLVFP
jgi:hypothetical protein